MEFRVASIHINKYVNSSRKLWNQRADSSTLREVARLLPQSRHRRSFLMIWWWWWWWRTTKKTRKKEKESTWYQIFFSASECLDYLGFWLLTCDWSSLTRSHMAQIYSLRTSCMFGWRSISISILISICSFFLSRSAADQSDRKQDVILVHM